LDHTYDLDAMYGRDYGYRSGLNRSMVEHLTDKASYLERYLGSDRLPIAVDIGSNDGTFLRGLPSYAIRVGYDPTIVKFAGYYPEGVAQHAEFFSAEAYRKSYGSRKADLVTSIACFYDLPDPQGFVDDVASILSDNGVWHFEQSYVGAMLARTAYDTICHEHLEYYGIKQVVRMLRKAGLSIIDLEFNDVNGGSFAVTAGRSGMGWGCIPAVDRILALESLMTDDVAWARFAERVSDHRTELNLWVDGQLSEGGRIYALGASTKGNVLLQYCGLDTRHVTACLEVNPDKFGCMTPGTRIPIVDEASVVGGADGLTANDVLLVLPWHFREGFVARRKASGGVGPGLLFPLPTIELLGGP
jgi:hypothetical protein